MTARTGDESFIANTASLFDEMTKAERAIGKTVLALLLGANVLKDNNDLVDFIYLAITNFHHEALLNMLEHILDQKRETGKTLEEGIALVGLGLLEAHKKSSRLMRNRLSVMKI